MLQVEVKTEKNEDFEIRSGMAFFKLVCLRCGVAIIKSALYDPYLCRECETSMAPEERFAFLDA